MNAKGPATPIEQEPLDDFSRHSREVYGWAYRVLGRHHDALDVVQDVFLRWMRTNDKPPLSSNRAWLRRVTLNRSIDVFRGRRAKTLPNELLDAKPASRVDSASAQAERDELRRDVATGLESISDVQRSILIAKTFDGLTFARIAEEHGVSVSTAKTHYLRAVRAIRDQLQTRWKSEEQA